MPRASTSVATRMSVVPAAKFSSARRRWFCVRLEWMASTEYPARFRRRHVASARLRVRANTMTRSCPHAAIVARRRSALSTCGTRTMHWSTVSAVSPLCAISTTSGSRKNVPATPSIERSMVAENKSVWRVFGVAATIFFTDGRKPISSMRSASSSTSTSTRSRCAAFCSMRSMRRPGVAISTSVPRFRALICGLYDTPPTTESTRWWVDFATASQTSAICAASSRVGVTTSMSGPRSPFACPSLSIEGSEKAAVLPVPVFAAAMMSCPSRTSGIARSCTGVGSS